MYSVYLHKRKTDNSVFYIGIGNNKRPYIKSNRSKFWKNEVNKHDYNVEILSNNLTWENAQEAEIYLINLYGRRDNNTGCLVNLTDGGDGSPGTIVSNETKCKISKKLKKFYSKNEHHSKGIKIDTSNYNRNFGKDNWMFGKDIFKGSKSSCSKKVIDITNNKIWNCIADCAVENNIKRSTLTAWLNGQNKNKSNFRFL